MESDWTVHRNWHRIVEEKASTTKKWISVVQFNKDDVGEFAVDEDEGYILGDLIGGSELELRTVFWATGRSKKRNRWKNHQRKWLKTRPEKWTRHSIAYHSGTNVAKISEGQEDASTSGRFCHKGHKGYSVHGESHTEHRKGKMTQNNEVESKAHRGKSTWTETTPPRESLQYYVWWCSIGSSTKWKSSVVSKRGWCRRVPSGRRGPTIPNPLSRLFQLECGSSMWKSSCRKDGKLIMRIFRLISEWNIDGQLFVSWHIMVCKLKKRLYGFKQSRKLC